MYTLKYIEKIFIAACLFFLTNGITDLVIEAYGSRDPISRVFPYLIQGVSIFFAFIFREQVVERLLKRPFLLVFLCFALTSILWSDTVSTTLRSLTTFLLTTLFGVYVSIRFTLKEQLNFWGWTLGTTAVLCLLLSLLLPKYGVMGLGNVVNPEALAHIGAWRGIYIHKNVMGRIMVLSGIIFSLLISAHPKRYYWLPWAGLFLSVALVILTTSKTSLVVLMTVLFLFPFYRALRWNYSFLLPFFTSVILIGGGISVLLIGNLESILGYFGRDLTLTGRTDLWAAVLEKISEHPWVGYGFSGFWHGWSGDSGDISTQLKWSVPHSHNGFLDLALDLGGIGFMLFILDFIMCSAKSVSLVRTLQSSEGLFPIAYLTFLVLFNLTESSLLRQNSLWFLYITTTFSLQNKIFHETPKSISFSKS
jgi:exopolysaccharide production protein ExoQ